MFLRRAAGMRIGECLNLSLDCLRDLSDHQWAIRIDVGKMHTETWVPLDKESRGPVGQRMRPGNGVMIQIRTGRISRRLT